MANPNPFVAPAVAPLVYEVNIHAGDEIVGIPTYADIVRERTRILQIDNGDKRGADFTDDEYGSAVMRYENIINVRSGEDLGNHNVGIGLQLTAIQQQLQQQTEMQQQFQQQMAAMQHQFQQQMEAMQHQFQQQMAAMQHQFQQQMAAMQTDVNAIGNRLNDIGNRFTVSEARIMADRAKAYNRFNRFSTVPINQWLFRPIVKYIQGHPTANPPGQVRRVDTHELVIFAPPEEGVYPVGSEPPDGLLPRTVAELSHLGTFERLTLRRVIRGIYWFYNCPELQLSPQATEVATRARYNQLEIFLTDL